MLAPPRINASDVQWIVNDMGELGVKIGDQFFFLYRGKSVAFGFCTHDDETPIMYRPVGKEEFGETMVVKAHQGMDEQDRFTDPVPDRDEQDNPEFQWRPITAERFDDNVVRF
jgi:hypothetical protein